MTVAVDPTLVGQQIDLLGKLNEVLRQHSAAASFRLVFAPTEMALAEDEVLVQVANADRGVVELHPRKVADLTPDDIIHTTQAIDIADDTIALVGSRGGGDCWPIKNPNGQTGHLYT